MRKIIEEKIVHSGWLTIVHRTIQHPNGGIQNYEIVNPNSHSVCAVAFDEDDQILLVDMYRFGPDRRLRELPAGGVERGETFTEAMHRELREETGHAGELTKVGSHLIGAEHGVTRHVFVARNCKRVSEPDLDQSEIDEGAHVVMVSLEEFRSILRSGEMTETGAGFMALDFLKLL